MSNFKQKYLNDDVTIEDLDNYVSMWHKSSDSNSLQEFLGFTDQEFEAFGHGETIIKKILDDLKSHKVASNLKKAIRKILN
jgi:hypothetical protein